MPIFRKWAKPLPYNLSTKSAKKNGNGKNPSNQIGKDAIYRVFTLRYQKNNDRNKVFRVFRAFRGQSFITMRN